MAAHHLLALVVCLLLAGTCCGDPLRPNIVWIMADDLGWGEPEAYPSVSPHGRLSTPNLNAFASEALRFTNAYAGYTVCAPSRTTLFTGRHSGHFAAMGVNGEDINVEENITTASQMLQKAGYITGAFGKTAPLQSPVEQGFDAFLGQVSQLYCHNMYPSVVDYAPPVDTSTHTSSVKILTANVDNYPSREACMESPSKFNYTIDLFQESALEWLDNVAAHSENPFFMYVAYTVPHAGGWGQRPQAPEQGQPVPVYYPHSNDSTWPDVEKDHSSVVTYLDKQVGEIMSHLKQLGIDNNTIVFFASDNGAHNEGGHDHTFFNSTGGLRGFKRSLYEGGVRSPSMVRWPGTIKPGVSDFQWAFWDVMPTMAELSGGKADDNIDGISILPTLLGQSQKPKDYIYYTWGAKKDKKLVTGYSVRVADWKGVVPVCNNKPQMSDSMELYDLSVDPFETNDISKAHTDVVQQLLQVVVPKNLTCQCYQC